MGVEPTAMKKVCPSCVEHQKQLTEWCRDIKREPAQLANILDTCTPSDLQSLKSIPEELWLHSMMQPSARIDTDLIREAIPAERLSEIPNLARVLETLELEETATPPAVMVCSDYSSEEDEGSFSDSSICSGEDDCEAEQIDFDWEVVDAVANSDTGEEGGSYYVNLKSNGSSESQWDRPVEGIIGRATKCICCGGKILEADDGFVFGDWDLGETGLQSLPDSFAHQELHITGSLLLDHNELRTLPEGAWKVRVDGHLLLNDNELSTLPDSLGNLYVKGNIYLHNNKLQSIPTCFERMYVGGDLHLQGNQLAGLPSSFPNVCGNVYNARKILRGKVYDCWKPSTALKSRTNERAPTPPARPAPPAKKESFQQVLDEEFGQTSFEDLLSQFKWEDREENQFLPKHIDFSLGVEEPDMLACGKSDKVQITVENVQAGDCAKKRNRSRRGKNKSSGRK